MLPVVLMQRGMPSRLYGKVPHHEGWCADRLVEQPLDLDALRVLFLDRDVFFCFHVDLME